MINVAQCRPVLLLFKGAVEYFQLCDGKDEGFVSGKSNNFRVVLTRPMTIGVRAGGGGRGGLQPPQCLGNSDFFGQREKIWAKPVS